MPQTLKAVKVGGLDWSKHGQPGYKGEAFNTHAERRLREGLKGIPNRTGGHWTNPDEHEGTKQGGDWFAEARKGGVGGTSASFGSKSPARKMAAAMIAKIPLPLSRHIAAVYRP